MIPDMKNTLLTGLILLLPVIAEAQTCENPNPTTYVWCDSSIVRKRPAPEVRESKLFQKLWDTEDPKFKIDGCTNSQENTPSCSGWFRSNLAERLQPASGDDSSDGFVVKGKAIGNYDSRDYLPKFNATQQWTTYGEFKRFIQYDERHLNDFDIHININLDDDSIKNVCKVLSPKFLPIHADSSGEKLGVKCNVEGELTPYSRKHASDNGFDDELFRGWREVEGKSIQINGKPLWKTNGRDEPLWKDLVDAINKNNTIWLKGPLVLDCIDGPTNINSPCDPSRTLEIHPVTDVCFEDDKHSSEFCANLMQPPAHRIPGSVGRIKQGESRHGLANKTTSASKQ